MSLPLLSRPLAELKLSDEFLKMAEANSFDSLQDVLYTPLHKIHLLPKSGYRMLRELVNFLTDNNLLHLAKG